MSVQMPDFMRIFGKRFTLIDVESGKQVISCGTFNIPETSSICSACWRGYTAQYSIDGETLYGIKQVGSLKSHKVMIPFTGSCIVAYSKLKHLISDFIFTYLDHDEAYELYFVNGKLVEQLSLASAIEKAKTFEKEGTNIDDVESFSRQALKYEYDDSTYRWRHKVIEEMF